LLRRTLAERFDGKKTNLGVLAGVIPNPGDASKCHCRKNFHSAGNKGGRGSVVINAASVAFEIASKG
jgi:hypothetical protein